MSDNDISILEKYGFDNIVSIVLLNCQQLPNELKGFVSENIEPVRCGNLRECFQCLMANDNSDEYADETYTLMVVNKREKFNTIKDFNVNIDNRYVIVYCIEDKAIDISSFEEDMRTRELTFTGTDNGTEIIAEKVLLEDTAFLSDEGILVKEGCATINVAGKLKKYYDTGDKFFVIDDVAEYDLLSNTIKKGLSAKRKKICLSMLSFVEKMCSADSFNNIMVIKNSTDEFILVAPYDDDKESSRIDADTVARFIYAAALGMDEILPNDRGEALVIIFDQLRKKLAENRREYSSELLVQLDELFVNGKSADIDDLKYTIDRMD